MRCGDHVLRAFLLASLLWLNSPFPCQTADVHHDSASAEGENLEAKTLDDPKKAFDFVVSGMKQERSRLVSGVCRFEGRRLVEYANRSKRHANLDGPLKGFLAFDFNEEELRYEITGPDWVVDPASIQSVGQSGRVTASPVAGGVDEDVRRRRNARGLLALRQWFRRHSSIEGFHERHSHRLCRHSGHPPL